MPIIEKTIRFAAIALAVLFIGVSLFGIFGAWFVNRKATDVALKGFGLIEVGIGVVDAGVSRVDDLIATSRTEVPAGFRDHHRHRRTGAGKQPRAQCAERASGDESGATHRADAAGAGSCAGCCWERRQRGEPAELATDDGRPCSAARGAGRDLDRLEGLSADATQLRGTLRALVVEQKSAIAPETVAALKGIAQRIDARLGEVQANIDGVKADIAALHVRLDARKSRLLFIFNLVAVLSTLMLAWILYTQVVVIQHHWARVRPPRPNRSPATTS